MEKPILDPNSKIKSNPDAFLEFRNVNAEKINNEICIPYYEQDAPLEDLLSHLNLSQEEFNMLKFVLESFKNPKSPDKLKRKNGQYIAVHSLQLFITARDYYGIDNANILYTLLLHDIAEDTQVGLEEIGQTLGEKFSNLASALTEEREEANIETFDSRKMDVVRFTQKIENAGEIAISAEILDRMDDISDLEYIFSKLKKDLENKDELDSAKKKLLEKFAKCSYTVSKINDANNELISRLTEDFYNLLDRQIEKIKNEYSIEIYKNEIDSIVSEYIQIEKNRYLKKRE